MDFPQDLPATSSEPHQNLRLQHSINISSSQWRRSPRFSVFFPSHVADVLPPVGAAVVREREADVSVRLPAAADLFQPVGHARQAESRAAQQDRGGEDQDQDKGGGHVEAVPFENEGAIPPVEKRVAGGHEQGAVAKRRLQKIKQIFKKIQINAA